MLEVEALETAYGQSQVLFGVSSEEIRANAEVRRAYLGEEVQT